MRTKTKMSGLLVIAMAVVGVMVYGCRKNENGRVSGTDQEQLLFENKSDGASYTPGDLLLGANVKKVTSIQADHSVVDRITASAEWKEATSGLKPDLSRIKRTYVYSTDASLITIPIISQGSSNEYFNVYVGDDKILLTRFSEIFQEGGVTTCKIQSATGELYYQFDLNDQHQLGNWKFEQELPKLYDGVKGASFAGRVQEDCSKKKFNSCMNCVIIDMCGSDWICSIACGLAIPSCVGGAALFCLVA